MAYLNVVPNPSPAPNVFGLGQVRRRRGFGQAPGASSVAAYLAGQLSQFPAPSEVAALVNGGPGNQYVGLMQAGIQAGASSPAEAAQQVYSLAQNFCNIANDAHTISGTPLPSDCASDGGKAAADAAYPQWLAYYNSLPASAWQAANSVASAPVYSCTFPNQPKYDSNGNVIGCFNVGTEQQSSEQPVASLPRPSYNIPAQGPGQVQQQAALAPTVHNAAQSPTQNGTQQSQPPTPAPVAPTPAAAALPDWLTNSISLGGMNIPVWGLAAAAVGLFLFMPRGR